jgi:hypothetical protein
MRMSRSRIDNYHLDNVLRTAFDAVPNLRSGCAGPVMLAGSHVPTTRWEVVGHDARGTEAQAHGLRDRRSRTCRRTEGNAKTN